MRHRLQPVKQMTLRKAREKRGWTQEQLEDASGVDQGVISRLERGESANPTNDTVVKLETALGLERGTLVFGNHIKALSA